MEDNIRRNKEAEVKVDKSLLKSLAINSDVLNTIGGGMATTMMELAQTKEGYLLKMRTPSLSAEAYNIEISRDQLMIYTTLPEQREIDLEPDAITPFFQSFPISTAVEIDEIDAVYEDGELQIFAPFREDFKSNEVKRINIRLI